MSKITDYSEIKNIAARILTQMDSSLLDYLMLEDAAQCVAIIYLTNDITSGFGQDYLDNISVISSPWRISIIFQGKQSFYKSDTNICQYNDLEDDLTQIITVADAAIARWEVL